MSKAKSILDILEDLIPGGVGDDRLDSDFDSEQLQAGIQVEMEHTDDPEKAKEIAKDHLSEDPEYYKKLALIAPDAKEAEDELNDGEVDESDPSLKPPKQWFDKMVAASKHSKNPPDNAEAVVGSIWYNLPIAKRKEIRAREGKHYGKPTK